MNARRIALGGLLLALALAASWLEFALPAPIPSLPGVKLGLANCVVLVVLYRFGARFALTVNIGRIVLAAFMFSGMWGALYSLAGGLFSFAVMAALKRSARFSIPGVSVAGGVAHNLAQLAVAALALGDLRVALYYYPALIVSGIVCGALVGLVASQLNEKIKNKNEK